jgi:signal peptidase II
MTQPQPSPVPANTPVPTSRFVVWLVIAVAGLTWDLWTKAWMFSVLGYPGRSSNWNWKSPLLWGRFEMQFTTSFNQGALFGIGQGLSLLFAALSVGAVAFIVYWLFIRGEARSWWLTLSLAAITAGTLGNLYDRLYLHGCRDAIGRPLTGVRDFIDCTIPWLGWGPNGIEWIAAWSWPIFNFADTYLVGGAIALVLHSLFVKQPEFVAATDPSRLAAVPATSSPSDPAPKPASSAHSTPTADVEPHHPGLPSLRTLSGFPSATGS